MSKINFFSYVKNFEIIKQTKFVVYYSYLYITKVSDKNLLSYIIKHFKYQFITFLKDLLSNFLIQKTVFFLNKQFNLFCENKKIIVF